MSPYEDLMIDVECMGQTPDGALMQIGAVFFNYQTMELGPTFLRNIHLATAVRDGGTLDPSTILWWLGQSDEARKVRFGGQEIREVLQDFSDWIETVCPHDTVRPWGNSNAFDLAIVGSAYKRAGITTPWYWTNERDFRTLRNLYPKVVYDTDEKGESAHDALADAIFQAKHFLKIVASKRRPTTTN